MAKPKPLLEPSDVLDACDQMIGRLEGMILKAEAEARPEVGAASMHPLIWGAAEPLWRDGHYRDAVRAAAEALVASVRARTGVYGVEDTPLWQQVFSEREPALGAPRLRWPGDPADLTVKSMTGGLRQLAPGLQMTIRNAVTHRVEEMGEQDARERLAALSLLTRWVTACELVTVDQAARETPTPMSGT